MGINSEFNYGIGLYNYSFAFSDLKSEEERKENEVTQPLLSHRFLASISKELFNGIAKNGRAYKTNIAYNWAFTCL